MIALYKNKEETLFSPSTIVLVIFFMCLFIKEEKKKNKIRGWLDVAIHLLSSKNKFRLIEYLYRNVEVQQPFLEAVRDKLKSIIFSDSDTRPLNNKEITFIEWLNSDNKNFYSLQKISSSPEKIIYEVLLELSPSSDEETYAKIFEVCRSHFLE